MTTESKLDCVFCKEVFEDKAALLIHFRKHGDPNFSSKNKNRQQNEMANSDKSVEENELVGCDVCEEVFPTISKAITHKHKAHPDHDTKYFCPFCGKLFTMKHLYNKHLQTSHESTEESNTNDFHCDSCDVSFNVASAMLYHNKFFHRQDTELPAFGQSKKVKMYSQELLQIYYCAFCGEEFNNKVNLHKHIGDDHEDENQSPTEILRCPLCEAIFYHLDAYELHLTFHSTEDLYSEYNEMKEQVTEFSLETVSPIMERVEEDDQTNAQGIDSFLQLVIGDSANSDTPDKLKSKKHKKHKKSKKAAITLDEFLNMNKDVFGDGLDVQGIEEVPTQVVLKKVKGKKLPTKSEPKLVNANLAKLKKHGIVVKTKSGKNPLLANYKKEMSKPNVKIHNNSLSSTPNEILSKLMNQGNSQIKIVKKSASQTIASTNDNDTLVTTNTIEQPIETTATTFDHEEESSKTTSICENDTNEEINEMCTSILESETSNNSKPTTQISNDDKINENENSDTMLEKSHNGTLENNSLSTIDTKSPSTHLEESSPDQSSPKPNDTKLEVTTDELTKESLNTDNDGGDNKDQEDDNITNTTLKALKHLSHLITVKPLNQGKNLNISKNNENKNFSTTTESKESDLIKKIPVEQKPISLNKSLGEQITIKPSKESPKTTSNFNSDTECETDEINDNRVDNSNTEYDQSDFKISNKSIPESKVMTTDSVLLNQEKVLNKIKLQNSSDSQEELNTDNCPKKANLDILKRLKNVTAKPIPVATKVTQVSNIKPDKSNVNQINKILPNNLPKGGVNEEIEIFNIDDSDSDDNESSSAANKNNKTEDKPLNIPLTTLKNLGSKGIVFKPKQTVSPNEISAKNVDTKNIKEENSKMNKQSQEIQKSINLQNKLRSLGGNITVKSRNPSPNAYNKELHKSFEDYDEEDEASFSDSESIGKVKISEMPENYDSGNECDESQTSAIIESPHASHSENEDNNDMEDDFSDFESQIKTNTLKKEETVATSKNNTCLENFKNLNKHLTIKSLSTKKCESEEDTNSVQKENSEDSPNANAQIVAKQVKSNILPTEQSNKSSPQASRSVNQVSIKNTSSSSSANQVNTVKTVQRFQSQTVIEEITTTVTKTIRTVNQSTNEVVQNRCNIKPTIRPQKLAYKQPGRELQGTTIRHASPVGTKIRTATSVVRNPNSTVVRAANQVIPVRPVLNIPRTAGPSTSAVRKVALPKCSPQNPPIGKLKISPCALNKTLKRPSEETAGHFSCFKKPKESLLSSIETPNLGDESNVQFSSTSQNRSDFSSVTKTVKGKGMITSTQARSEVTSSQQQLSRLSNVSGLKIVKTSSKQATQVEEKCEINTAKKNTLEALEKLQKQGLLIKKPRIEECNEQQDYFSESDDEGNEK